MVAAAAAAWLQRQHGGSSNDGGATARPLWRWLVAAIVAPVVLIHEIANLVVVALCHFVAEFVFGVKPGLFLMLLCERAVGHLRVVDVVEVLGNGLEGFIAEVSSTLKVPCTVLLVKQRVCVCV